MSLWLKNYLDIAFNWLLRPGTTPNGSPEGKEEKAPKKSVDQSEWERRTTDQFRSFFILSPLYFRPFDIRPFFIRLNDFQPFVLDSSRTRSPNCI